ncbi:protein kinase, partial [bacterium]|nr:protein kinase [candidate division CSSED10-310 bacterium]
AGTDSKDLGTISPEDLTERNFLQQYLANKFEITRELGRGGFGVVFEALDLRLNRKVAIKALHLVKSSDEALVRRFIKEAQLAAQLEHPAIVRIYNIDSAGAVHYFIMEYVDGPTLKDYIRELGAVSPYETVKICREVSRALSFAHSKGIVHRDIKPHNIILKHGEIPVVTDFGIAKALDTDATQLTSGAIGSPHYISPEQLRNEDIDARTDQYSLGIMMYEMLTGKPPFQGAGMVLLHKQISETPVYLRQIDPAIPQILADLVHKLLEKERDNRYLTTSDLIVALENIDLVQLPRKAKSSETTLESVDKSVSDLINDVKEALGKKEFEQAIELCEKGREIVPDNLDLVFLLQQAKTQKEAVNKAKIHVNEGIEKFHAKHYTEAIEAWYEALALDESNSEIEKFIVQAQKAQNEYRQAKKLFALGKKLFQEQKYSMALEKLRAVEAIDPEFDEVKDLIRKAEAAEVESRELKSLIEEGEKLQDQKRYHESIKLFRSILERDPVRPEARKGLERSLREIQKIEEIRKLQDRWPRYRKDGHYERAIEVLQRLQTLRPDKRDQFGKIIEEINLEKSREEQASRLASSAIDAHKQRKYHEAVKIWEQIRQLNPRNQHILDGEKLTQEALRRQESADERVAEAKCIAMEGLFEEALDRIKKIAADVSDPIAVKSQVDHYEKLLNQKNKLINWLETAIEKGDQDKATAEINRWLKEFPKDELVLSYKRKVDQLQDAILKPPDLVSTELSLATPVKTQEKPQTEQKLVEDEKDESEKGGGVKSADVRPSRRKEVIIALSGASLVLFLVVVFVVISRRWEFLSQNDKSADAILTMGKDIQTPTITAHLGFEDITTPLPTRSKIDEPTVAVAALPSTPTIIPMPSIETKQRDIVATPTPQPIPFTPVPTLAVSYPVNPTYTPLPIKTSTPSVDKRALERMLAEADSAINQKDYRNALLLLNKALDMDKNSIRTIDRKNQIQAQLDTFEQELAFARQMFSRGQLNDAKQTLTKLLDRDPFNSSASDLLRQVEEEISRQPVAPSTSIEVRVPEFGIAGDPVIVRIVGTTNVRLKSLTLYYREDNKDKWKSILHDQIGSGKILETYRIPGNHVSRGRIQIYAELIDETDTKSRRGSPEMPYEIPIKSRRRIPIGGM